MNESIRSSEIANQLIQLEDFITRLTLFSESQQQYFAFSSLVRTSLIKNYEFLKLTYCDDDFEGHFFATSFLRGIVEDIIVLESVHKLAPEKREALLRGMQILEVNERTSTQWNFFQKYRPFQPVINKTVSTEDAQNAVQTIWRECGWAKFEAKPKSITPPIVQLAQKLAPGILDLLYEFIYRLTSSTVHFSPQTLLRMGWGNVDSENKISGTISAKHMANYHKAFCRIYGLLLFTFYFEFFPDEIDATHLEQLIVVNIRKTLLEESRWPEMITFEEMNLPVPKLYHDQVLTYKIIHQAIIESMKGGFINSKFEGFIEQFKISPNAQ